MEKDDLPKQISKYFDLGSYSSTPSSHSDEDFLGKIEDCVSDSYPDDFGHLMDQEKRRSSLATEQLTMLQSENDHVRFRHLAIISSLEDTPMGILSFKCESAGQSEDLEDALRDDVESRYRIRKTDTIRFHYGQTNIFFYANDERCLGALKDKVAEGFSHIGVQTPVMSSYLLGPRMAKLAAINSNEPLFGKGLLGMAVGDMDSFVLPGADHILSYVPVTQPQLVELAKLVHTLNPDILPMLDVAYAPLMVSINPPLESEDNHIIFEHYGNAGFCWRAIPEELGNSNTSDMSYLAPESFVVINSNIPSSYDPQRKLISFGSKNSHYECTH